MKPKIFKIRLETLTPVHIGCDEEYTPVNFIIDPNKQHLILFDFFELVETLDDRERNELNKIASIKGVKALVELYKFYYYRLKEKIIKLKKLRFLRIPQDLAQRYLEIIKLNREQEIYKEFNSFAIPRTFYNPLNNEPVIPGSSLKGALRTGYLEKLLEKKKEILEKNKKTLDDRYKKNAQELENWLLDFYKENLGANNLKCRNISKDPFRLIKVSDFRAENFKETEIYYQINISKAKGEMRPKLSLPIEVIPKGTIFSGEIRFDERLSISCINHLINSDNFFKKIKYRYLNIFNYEKTLLQNFDIKLPISLEHAQSIKENRAILIKIGKHSSAEAVTLEGVRAIKVRGPGGRTEIRNSSTTMWLASPSKKKLTDAQPFGWVILFLESVV